MKIVDYLKYYFNKTLCRLTRSTEVFLTACFFLVMIGSSLALMAYDPKILFWVGTGIIVLIAIIVNSFVVVYWRRNWRANPYGRAVMYSKISLALLCNMTLITLFLGEDWEWRPLTRVLVFSAILVAQARLFQLLFSAESKADQKKFDDTHDSKGKAI